MYPVEITSKEVDLSIGAACTCCQIKRSGFRPEMRERNKIASADSEI
jgi:hypothetical protein